MGQSFYPHIYGNHEGLIKGEEEELLMLPIGAEVLYPLAARYPGLIRPDVVRAIFRASDGTLVAHAWGLMNVGPSISISECMNASTETLIIKTC
jgi:hypothetical protein